MKGLPTVRPHQKRVAWADAVLASVVVAVVALMIVPLPTPLLDALLSVNLALSVAVLLVTLYVTDPLHVTSFPTLLLVTTLIRLGLNIAATRLILLRANAGEVIAAFGKFVVGSNYVVGGVIFALLTLIQYLVIAKGSERVAEVGARFTLDALPGKQMSIDAELRSGAINSEEAQWRRRQLVRESQFYGSMDGAMKFVKGDIIASILIASVNLLGGLTIGMLQRNMDAVGALKRYGLLTIGSGLVTQIPALILATSAGVLVTRVASEEPNTSLGSELGAQLLGAPQALFVAGALLIVMSLIPGLPTIPFLVIGVLLFLASRARARHLSLRSGTRAMSPVVQRGERSGELRFVPIVIPWSLKVAPNVMADAKPTNENGLVAATNHVRERLFVQLGVPLPPCVVVEDPALAPSQARLYLHEVPGPILELNANTPEINWTRVLEEHVLPALQEHAADFIGLSETQRLLDELESAAPHSVQQVVPKPLALTTLSEVLRRLVDESVSIRNLGSILEVLSQVASSEKDPLALAEHVRAQLRRSLTQQWTGGQARLSVILLDPSLEDVIRTSITRTSVGSFLALAPSACRDVVAAVRRALEQARGKAPSPVLLSAPDIRRFVRRLIESDMRHLPVVSAAELLPEVALETVATATVTNL